MHGAPATYHVAPAVTLAQASRAARRPGDRLLLRRGASWSGELDVAAGVRVGAYGRGAPPRITGKCVRIVGPRAVVRGLHLDRCAFAGVTVDADRARVEDNLATHNVAGVYVRPGTTGAIVARNVLRDNDRMSRNTKTPKSDDTGAFGVLLRGDRAIVAHNVISGSDAFSYDFGRDGSAVEIFGGRDNVIERNLAVDNNAFTELGNPRSANNTYAYNVVRARQAIAEFLVTRGAGSPLGPIAATRVFNNTVRLTGARSQGVLCHAGCTPGILTMRNNIIGAALKAGFADGAFDEDYDFFYGGRVDLPLGPHSRRVADPRFAAPRRGNLRLRASSPALRAGVGVGYHVDFSGRRVPSRRPDLGAYQRSRG